ncbi:hypothetical protein Zmor_010474 [Zophobas morio]|uniref:Uncharacterized protein n=1 Tax=Zophobas morio TaxID=2755281 RepID=A0AA38IJ83_9CUCU|nr:hypothetical protein Zmor_010474 [Zophobas morio]
MWTVGEQVCLQQYNRVVLDGNLMMCGHDSTVYVIQINCTTVASNGTLECEWPALGLPKWWIIIKGVEVTEKFIIYDDITCNGKITTCFTDSEGNLKKPLKQVFLLCLESRGGLPL